MNQAITSQALSFCPVIPAADEPEGQIRDAEGNVWIQIKADHASDVSLIIYEQKFPFIKEEGIWKLKYPGKDGITLVQLQIDGMNVLTPYLPICYGYSRPYNYVSIETEEEFYYLKNVPHGTVRQEYFYSDITGEWERCFVYTPVNMRSVRKRDIRFCICSMDMEKMKPDGSKKEKSISLWII